MDKMRLLDAGFSSQLSKYVNEQIDGHPLWSARFLVSHKDTCVAVHRDYIRAGADIIRTGSYQASIDGFVEHLGMSKKEAVEAIKDSVAFVKKAIKMEADKSGKNKEILIAGSVGPYAIRFHDGSEYTGSYANDISVSRLEDWHRPKIEALLSAGVDLLAFETVPCRKEAITLARLLKEYPQTRAWISFSAKDSVNISTGENFVEAATTCWNVASNQLIAIGVNCLSPELVLPLLSKLLKANPSIPLLASPHSGELFDTGNCRWIKKETKNVAAYVEEWLNLGISYVGGCCRTNADDTQQLAQQIHQWRNKIL